MEKLTNWGNKTLAGGMCLSALSVLLFSPLLSTISILVIIIGLFLSYSTGDLDIKHPKHIFVGVISITISVVSLISMLFEVWMLLLVWLLMFTMIIFYD